MVKRQNHLDTVLKIKNNKGLFALKSRKGGISFFQKSTKVVHKA